jgi:hypothetical protein
MKVSIRAIRYPGILDAERVVIIVNEDVELGEFAVAATRAKEGGPADGIAQAFYWFPDGPVKKGDLIILYTKKGTRSTRVNVGGNTSYFFYLWRPEPIWTENNVAVLLRVASWEFALSPTAGEADEKPN